MRVFRIFLLMFSTVSSNGCQHMAGPPDWPAGWMSPAAGSAPHGAGTAPPLSSASPIPNPMRVPALDREFLWNQLADTIDDYFRIESERRVQLVGGVLTEGQLETHYEPGATVLEPWRPDSASEYERTLATLQSLRRRASVRVVPSPAGYEIYVVVYKELEDVDRPAQGTPGASTPRYDAALARLRDFPGRAPRTLGWIGIGRDVALEQQILSELYGRLFDTYPDTSAHPQWPW